MKVSYYPHSRHTEMVMDYGHLFVLTDVGAGIKLYLGDVPDDVAEAMIKDRAGDKFIMRPSNRISKFGKPRLP